VIESIEEIIKKKKPFTMEINFKFIYRIIFLGNRSNSKFRSGRERKKKLSFLSLSLHLSIAVALLPRALCVM
jgi:hypothetical protein